MFHYFLWHATVPLSLWEVNIWILSGIKLSSASISALYTIWIHLWLVLGSILVNITDFTLSILLYFYPYHIKASVLLILFIYMLVMILANIMYCFSTMQVLLCCHIDLHTTLKWFCFLHLLCFLPYDGHCLEGTLHHSICNHPLSCPLSVLWTCLFVI